MPANSPISGIHHVTAITADAQKSIAFYCDLLGLRFVKLSVNFDDPRSYHLYYGDELGRPGTAMTFFLWPGIPRGRIGPPQVSATSFAIPGDPASFTFWLERLKASLAEPVETSERFGQRVITVTDPDGMSIELLATGSPSGRPWTNGGVPAEHAIVGFAPPTISLEAHERTAALLTGAMGFAAEGASRIASDSAQGAESPAGFASQVDLLCVPDAREGLGGGGIVHHLAFRTPDTAYQARLRKALVGQGFNVSPVMDRKYFQSIYFREPGGVLFEIATDGPGFTVDETPDRLGSGLMLPPHFEHHRAAIERRLPPITLPGQA